MDLDQLRAKVKELGLDPARLTIFEPYRDRLVKGGRIYHASYCRESDNLNFHVREIFDDEVKRSAVLPEQFFDAFQEMIIWKLAKHVKEHDLKCRRDDGSFSCQE